MGFPNPSSRAHWTIGATLTKISVCESRRGLGEAIARIGSAALKVVRVMDSCPPKEGISDLRAIAEDVDVIYLKESHQNVFESTCASNCDRRHRGDRRKLGCVLPRSRIRRGCD